MRSLFGKACRCDKRNESTNHLKLTILELNYKYTELDLSSVKLGCIILGHIKRYKR